MGMTNLLALHHQTFDTGPTQAAGLQAHPDLRQGCLGHQEQQAEREIGR